MSIEDLVSKIKTLEDELDLALENQRKDVEQQIGAKREQFTAAIKQEQRRFKTGILRYLKESGLPFVLFSPLVYMLIVPLIMLDLFVTTYQFFAFPIYGIKKVKRSEFIVLDRQHLAYLNAIEKLNCVYCGYANGLLAYVREIAGRSEERFCPIKHARRTKGQHRYYHSFSDYGDAEGLAEKEAAVLRKSHKQLTKDWDSDDTL